MKYCTIRWNFSFQLYKLLSFKSFSYLLDIVYCPEYDPIKSGTQMFLLNKFIGRTRYPHNTHYSIWKYMLVCNKDKDTTITKK